MQINFDTVITMSPIPITVVKSESNSLLIDTYRREEIIMHESTKHKIILSE